MYDKTPSIIAIVLTVFFMILLGLVFLFAEIIALNGFSEQEATIALGALCVCQGTGMILAALLAGWFTRWGIMKMNWHKALAIVVAVFAATFLGGILSTLGLVVSIILVA